MAEVTKELEEIERLALADLHAAAPEDLRQRLGLRLEEIEGALVSIAAAEPSILLNRTLGLGLDRPATATAVERITQAYLDAGIGRFFVQLVPGARPADLLQDWLGAAGLVEARAWMKFTRDASSPPAPLPSPAALDVRPIGPEHGPDFARIAARAFDLSPAAEPLIAALALRPGWHLYMSFAGDRPAGTGALFVAGEVGYLDWGATDPTHRRQGGQSAVLRRRIQDAPAQGCRSLVTTTGEAVPGDPQHSYRNIERVGFQAAYRRANWAPPRQS